MTTRELQITRSVLNFLHTLEGGQATEIQIHQAVATDPEFEEAKPSAAEIAVVMQSLDSQKFIIGVPTRFNKRVMKWNINDAGEAARLEMR